MHLLPASSQENSPTQDFTPNLSCEGRLAARLTYELQGQGEGKGKRAGTEHMNTTALRLGMNQPPGDLPTSAKEKSSQRGAVMGLEEPPEGSGVSPSLPVVLCVPPEGTNSCNHSRKSHVAHFQLQEC